MKKYRRLDWSDRLRIEALYNTGNSCSMIARHLGFAPSSIYREVKHGLYEHMGAETTKRPWRYSAQIAQEYADYQSTAKGTDIKLGTNHDYAREVAQKVRLGISIDTIVNVKKRNGQWTVSTTTLYRYIDRGYIPGVTSKHLPEKPYRKQRRKSTVKAVRAPKGLPIDRRPEDVAHRKTFGHWEFDSVIGKAKGQKQSILTLTERKTRFEIILRTQAKPVPPLLPPCIKSSGSSRMARSRPSPWITALNSKTATAWSMTGTAISISRSTMPTRTAHGSVAPTNATIASFAATSPRAKVLRKSHRNSVTQ